jgi:hypothetical protein
MRKKSIILDLLYYTLIFIFRNTSNVLLTSVSNTDRNS